MSSTMRFTGKVLYVCVFFCIIALVSSQLNLAGAKEGGPCPKKKIQEHFYCTACDEIREFKDCDTADYIWDFEKYKAGSEEYADAKVHQDLPVGWGCQRIQYSCINKDCSEYDKCIPHPGICDTCMDDITSRKIWSKVVFRCSACNKDHDHPGEGHKLNERIEYIPTLVSPGKCEDCGKPLETVCTKSGTCPHVPSF